MIGGLPDVVTIMEGKVGAGQGCGVDGGGGSIAGPAQGLGGEGVTMCCSASSASRVPVTLMAPGCL